MKLDRVIAVRNTKTIYRDGDKCFKVFHQAYSKAKILNEAFRQTCAEETGLRVPKILEVSMIDQEWVIVSEYIKGTTLERLMRENPDQKARWLTLFVELQRSVHAKSCPRLCELNDGLRHEIRKADLTATMRADLHARLEVMPRRHKFLHGDFDPSNVILMDDGTPCLLDWEYAALGNAAADVARTCLLFRLHGDTGEAEAYLNLFCQTSGMKQSQIEAWLPIIAASQSIRVNEAERKFLLDLASGTRECL